METLISTGTIASIKEVWWDIRPHPTFGTVELRICDGLPTLHEVGMVAALSQCLVETLRPRDRQAATRCRCPRAGWCARTSGGPRGTGWTPRSSREDGAGAAGARGDRATSSRTCARPPSGWAARPSSSGRRDASRAGASYQRQRAVAAASGGDLTAVVDSLLAEFAQDRRRCSRPRPRPPARGRRDRVRRLAGPARRGPRRAAPRPARATPSWAARSTARRRCSSTGSSGRARPQGPRRRHRPGVRGRATATGRWSGCAPTSTRCRCRTRRTSPTARAVPGVCHACGHDVHTAVVLGAGLALAGLDLPGRVRLVFQPAEELMPGRRAGGVDEGWAEGLSAMYALHCDPSLEVGRLGVRTGPITSAADSVHGAPDRAPAGTPPGRTTPSTSSTPWPPSPPGCPTRSAASSTRGPGCAWSGGTSRRHGRQRHPPRGRAARHAAGARQGRLGDGAAAGAPGRRRAGRALRRRRRRHLQRGVPPVVNDAGAQRRAVGAATAVLGQGRRRAHPAVARRRGLRLVPRRRSPARWPGSASGRPGRERPLDLHQGSFDVDEDAIAVGVRVLVATALAALGA